MRYSVVTEAHNLTGVYEMSTTKTTVSGGFHNATPITLSIRGDKMSLRQYDRLNKHMCGVSGCICGWRGFEVTGVTKEKLLEMTEFADYARYA